MSLTIAEIKNRISEEIVATREDLSDLPDPASTASELHLEAIVRQHIHDGAIDDPDLAYRLASAPGVASVLRRRMESLVVEVFRAEVDRELLLTP